MFDSFMFHDEIQIDSHLERSSPLPLPSPAEEEGAQRKRMLIALGILLVALAAVLLKDWDFWFPPDGETQEATVRSKRGATTAIPAAGTTTPSAAAAGERKSAKAPAPATAEAPLSTTTERA